MQEPKRLTAAEVAQMIEQLETVADTLFAAGANTLGNAVQDVAYLLERNFANAYSC